MTDAQFTDEQYREFSQAVFDCESRDQVRRVAGRMKHRRMIADLGRDACDAMWEKFKKEHGE